MRKAKVGHGVVVRAWEGLHPTVDVKQHGNDEIKSHTPCSQQKSLYVLLVGIMRHTLYST